MEVTISKGMTWRTWFPKVQEESTNQSTLSQVETWTVPKKWCFPILEISRLQGVIVQVPCKTLGCLTRLDVNMKPFEPFEKKVQIQRHAILMLLDPSQVPGTPKVRYDWTPKTDLKKHHVTGDVYRDYRPTSTVFFTCSPCLIAQIPNTQWDWYIYIPTFSPETIQFCWLKWPAPWAVDLVFDRHLVMWLHPSRTGRMGPPLSKSLVMGVISHWLVVEPPIWNILVKMGHFAR